MPKVSVAEISGLSREITNPLVRVQLRESEGISGFPASLARRSPDIDPWKGGSLTTHITLKQAGESSCGFVRLTPSCPLKEGDHEKWERTRVELKNSGSQKLEYYR